MKFAPQKVYCPACGQAREADPWHDIGHTFALCCDQSCYNELYWRWVLHSMNRAYYPDPKGTGRWSPTRSFEPDDGSITPHK